MERKKMGRRRSQENSREIKLSRGNLAHDLVVIGDKFPLIARRDLSHKYLMIELDLQSGFCSSSNRAFHSPALWGPLLFEMFVRILSC